MFNVLFVVNTQHDRVNNLPTTLHRSLSREQSITTTKKIKTIKLAIFVNKILLLRERTKKKSS